MQNGIKYFSSLENGPKRNETFFSIELIFVRLTFFRSLMIFIGLNEPMLKYCNKKGGKRATRRKTQCLFRLVTIFG